MELLEGKKYRNRNTEKSIIDIKINDDYIIYVFQGTLSQNDIVIKYSKNAGRMRTPKHIHWVIDMLLKEQKNSIINSTLNSIENIILLWQKVEPQEH